MQTEITLVSCAERCLLQQSRHLSVRAGNNERGMGGWGTRRPVYPCPQEILFNNEKNTKCSISEVCLLSGTSISMGQAATFSTWMFCLWVHLLELTLLDTFGVGIKYFGDSSYFNNMQIKVQNSQLT
jgi:hypothetical protein